MENLVQLCGFNNNNKYIRKDNKNILVKFNLNSIVVIMRILVSFLITSSEFLYKSSSSILSDMCL